MKRRSPTAANVRSFRVRPAFTLFEITLVLALLLVLGALAWPALDGIFASERLKYAADQLRSDFIRARVTAMNTGRVHVFSWDPTTAHYYVTAVDDGSTDPFSVPSDMNVAASLPVINRMLPEGVTLHNVAALDDVTPPPAVAMTAGFGAAALTTSTTMPSVYFHPDGTTSSALVTLVGDGDMFLDVRLRGLTGGTAVDDVLVAQGASR